MGKLEVNHLSVTIGNRKFLENIHFTLAKEKTLVIIGESGSGKTMLTKLLIGQFPEDEALIEGEILLEGNNLLSLKEDGWRRYRGSKIAYIAQNPMALFNPSQSILSHAKELFKSRMTISNDECEDKLTRALENFNLKDAAQIGRKYPFQLSGGMLQRIMFAMMSELSPSLIIADEPTSALDEGNTQRVIDTLKRCQSEGVSMIVVTHDYDLVHQLADDIMIMKDGRVIEYGAAKSLLEHPESDYAKALLMPKCYERYWRGNND